MNNFEMSELFQIFSVKLREKNFLVSEKSNFKRFEPKLAELLRVQNELSEPSRNSHQVGIHRRFFKKHSTWLLYLLNFGQVWKMT
jgi:hypothetical protein